MSHTASRRITHFWLTCGAGALAGFALLADLSPAFAQGPTASRWSSAPVQQFSNPTHSPSQAIAPPETYRVGDQAPGPTRVSSNPARPSLADAQRMSEPPEEAHLVRLPPVDDEPVARRSVSDEPLASTATPAQESKSPNTTALNPASVTDPASLVEIVPGRPRDEALTKVANKPQQDSFISRFSKAGGAEPIAQSAFSGSTRSTVTDDAQPAQPAAPEQVAVQTTPAIPPSKPEPRRPASRIDWNHPQVVIGPAQPAGAPIQNQHVVQASGESEDFFSFDPTRGSDSAIQDDPTSTPAVATEAPNQLAQDYESGSVKLSELTTPPQRELSPITACRILGLKPATERR